MALITRSSYATLMQELEGLIIPNLVIEILKPLNFYIKMSEPWIQGETTIPPRYVVLRTPSLSLASLNSYVETIRSNQGEAKMHMDKFGIKYSTWDQSLLEARELTINDIDAIAYFQHAYLMINNTTGSPQYYKPQSIDLGQDGGEDYKYYFADNPNESVINVLAKLFHTREATYNKYGGTFVNYEDPGGNSDMCVQCKYTESTEFLANTVLNNFDILSQFRAFWEQTDTLNVSLTGTGISNDDYPTWLTALLKDLKYGSGLDENRSDAVLESFARSVMF
jgi:hypothetical protein